jgi:hypothetical protein
VIVRCCFTLNYGLFDCAITEDCRHHLALFVHLAAICFRSRILEDKQDGPPQDSDLASTSRAGATADANLHMSRWLVGQVYRAIELLRALSRLYPTLAAKTKGLQEQAEVPNHDSRRKV